MRAGSLIAAILVCLSTMIVQAANTAPARSSLAAPSVNGSRTIDLARSMESLTEWKFQPGDNPNYAQPGYDDSGWKPMSIEPLAHFHAPYFSSDSFAPGWTALGFPNLTGYAWYRARLKLAGSHTDLWLDMPTNIDDAYQVYANGQLMGSMGEFTENHVKAFYSHPMKFHLPAPDANGDIVLALRFFMQPESVQWNFEAGGMHAPPVIGLAQTVALLQQRNQDAEIDTTLSYPPLGLLAWLAGMAALWIYFIDPSEKAYLWLAATFIIEAVLYASNFIASMTYLIPYSAEVLINDAIGSALNPLCWLLFWAYWFRLRAIRLLGRIAWTLVLLELCTAACMRQPVMGSLISLSWTHDLWLLSSILRIVLALLLVAVTVDGIRRNRTEGLIALPAVLLLGINSFSDDLEVLGIRVEYFPYGIRLGIEDISLFVLILVVLSLVIHRFLQTQVRQREMTRDLQQAQEVQALLVPTHLPQTPGYRVEGTYLPASQVGGDFYQVLPLPDGGLIVVLGDVSGKGLRAAMVVSMAVGAVRAIVKETMNPAEILQRLNHELTGNLKSGFVTCICARLDADGTVTVANAGHLPPWANGKEVEMQGALPLGIMSVTKYETQSFHLNDGDGITVLSDGVVEARREKDGQLYGFDRLAAMLQAQPSAKEVAITAQRFGQEDDISVLQIRRLARAEASVAPMGNLVTT